MKSLIVAITMFLVLSSVPNAGAENFTYTSGTGYVISNGNNTTSWDFTTSVESENLPVSEFVSFYSKKGAADCFIPGKTVVAIAVKTTAFISFDRQETHGIAVYCFCTRDCAMRFLNAKAERLKWDVLGIFDITNGVAPKLKDTVETKTVTTWKLGE